VVVETGCEIAKQIRRKDPGKLAICKRQFMIFCRMDCLSEMSKEEERRRRNFILPQQLKIQYNI